MDEPKKIMIVEDEKASALLLSRILQNAGYNVLGPVDSGEKAIESVAGLNPDLILMDITLKGELDGITTAQRIQEIYPYPVIYATVSTDDRIIKRAKSTVPYGYILKPYDSNITCATVEMALNKIENEKRLRISEERNRAVLSALPDTVFYTDPDGFFSSDMEKNASRYLWNEKVAERARPVIRTALEKKKAAIFNYALSRRGGTAYYEARVIPNLEDQVLVIVRDVTSKRDEEKREADYRKELEARVTKRTSDITAVNQKLEREVLLRQKMEENLRIFGHAIEQNPNVVVIINRQGSIEYVNSAFTNLSGYGKSEVVGRNVSSPDNHVIPEPEIWERMVGVKKWRGESYGLGKDGNLFYLDTVVSSIIGEDGEISHYIIIAEDCTQAKRDRMAVDQARMTLEQADKELMSRELDWKEWQDKIIERNVSRTDKSLFKNIHTSFTQGAGFGTIVSLIDMMTSTARQEANGMFLVDGKIINMIQKNIKLIREAIETFSGIDWIISNEFELQRVSLYDLYETVRAVIGTADSLREINNNRIITNDFNYGFKDLAVNLNRQYFSKALYEVLINAMKFSLKNSPVTVLVNATARDAIVSVINEPEKGERGMAGIPVEFERVVFEPFYRLTRIVHEQYGTLELGLGLTMVEKIMSRHGGEVSARNILDHSAYQRETQVKVDVSLSMPLLNG